MLRRSAILGASMSIHPVALPLFAEKRVRIFPHYDAERFNGFDAARRWEAQLRERRRDRRLLRFHGPDAKRRTGRVRPERPLPSRVMTQWEDEAREILP